MLHVTIVLMLSPGEHCVHTPYEHCDCTAAAVVVRAVAAHCFEIRRSVSRIAVLPLRSIQLISAPFSRSSMCSFLLPHTHTQKKCAMSGRHKRESSMNGCCCAVSVESSSGGVIRHDTAAARSRNKYLEVWGLHCPAWRY